MASPPKSSQAAAATKLLYNKGASLTDLFGELKGKALMDSIFATYASNALPLSSQAIHGPMVTQFNSHEKTS
jgi:hypothetical protein